MPKILQRFLKLEAASGIILFATAAIGLLWANSPFADFYQLFTRTFLFTINEGLMAFFFLLVGLELKRGLLRGSLSKPENILLPLTAAVGGMVVPALIYWFFNSHAGIAMQGIATPVATDIAFALGVLSLFGKRIPEALKLFLLALAIFDDLGAILIIALFYTQGFAYLAFTAAALFILALYLLNRTSVRVLWPYLLCGIGLWVALLYSGIHPTIAGVVLAFAVPVDSKLEANLHPYVAYFIMPLFALTNAGMSLAGMTMDILSDSIVQGIMFGLFIGKQIGVFGFSCLLMYCFKVKLPQKTSLSAFYGVAVLCGIGFTMSLFLGTLSFQSESAIYITKVRTGVLAGSMLSALFGSMVLACAKYKYK